MTHSFLEWKATLVRPDIENWGQTLADLRVLSVKAKDARYRKRFPAMQINTDRATSKSRQARAIGLTRVTVLHWADRCKQLGPEAVSYRHTGGCRPPLAQSGANAKVGYFAAGAPVDHIFLMWTHAMLRNRVAATGAAAISPDPNQKGPSVRRQVRPPFAVGSLLLG